MGIKRTLGVAVEANKAAAVLTAEVTAGNLINDRLAKIIMGNKSVPTMVKLGVDSPIGKAVMSNAVAAALIHFMPTNDKAMRAADAMIKSAMLEFGASFDVEGMIDELLDGITLPDLGATDVKPEPVK